MGIDSFSSASQWAPFARTALLRRAPGHPLIKMLPAAGAGGGGVVGALAAAAGGHGNLRLVAVRGGRVLWTVCISPVCQSALVKGTLDAQAQKPNGKRSGAGTVPVLAAENKLLGC